MCPQHAAKHESMGDDKLEVLSVWRVRKLSDLVNPIAVFMHSYSGIPHIGGGKNRITSREDTEVFSLPRSLQKMVTSKICRRKDQMLGVSMHQVPSVSPFMRTTGWATASICGKFCGFFPFSRFFCRPHRQQFVVLLYCCIFVLLYCATIAHRQQFGKWQPRLISVTTAWLSTGQSSSSHMISIHHHQCPFIRGRNLPPPPKFTVS